MSYIVQRFNYIFRILSSLEYSCINVPRCESNCIDISASYDMYIYVYRI